MHFELIRHKLAYVILLCGLTGFTLLYFVAWPDVWAQRAVSLALGAFYALWGLIAHVKSEHLTKQVTYEYLGIATLSTLLLLLITI